MASRLRLGMFGRVLVQGLSRELLQAVNARVMREQQRRPERD